MLKSPQSCLFALYLLTVLSIAGRSAPALEPFQVPDDLWEKVRQACRRQFNAPPEKVDKWRPYALPTNVGPRPKIENEALAELGYVDVTAAPFSADPTGARDSTEAIRAAVHYARTYRMAAFFPPGDYLISDMLHCYQSLMVNDRNPRRMGELGFGEDGYVALIGSTKDPKKRARIVLKENSPGFGDPAKPKYVVLIQRPPVPGKRARTPLSHDSCSVNYSNVFVSIDITVKSGNPGAIGIRLRGAEGSTIQDVTIDLRKSGLTGMQCLAGSGGSHHGITVLGGVNGINTADYLPGMSYSQAHEGTQPNPTLSNVCLKGQKQWALRSRVRGALIVVGAEIETDKQGPVIEIGKGDTPHDNCVALIDARIRYAAKHEANSVVQATRSFYFQDVFIENSSGVAQAKQVRPPATGWLHIRQLAVDLKKSGKMREQVWVNGQEEGDRFYSPGGLSAPPDDLMSKHHWGRNVPSFESPDVGNVKQYGAKGDDKADDSDAIQKTIDNHEIVFLPKGRYKIKKTLKLKPNTKMIGVHHKISSIHVADNRSDGQFGGPNPDPQNIGRPGIETADDAEAKTYLAFFGLQTDMCWAHHDPTPLCAYSLKWQCGPKSLVRHVQIGPFRNAAWNVYNAWRKLKQPADRLNRKKDLAKKINIYDAFPGDIGAINHSPVLVTGNGGGKWYNFWLHGYMPYDKHVRLMLIDGNKHPFRVYHLHGQHSHAHAIFEMRNARDVDIFGNKTECHTRLMDIKNSQRVRIFGAGGAWGPGMDVKGKKQTLFWFQNCQDYMIAAFGQQVQPGRQDKIHSFDKVQFRFPLLSFSVDSYDPIWDDPHGGSRVKMPRVNRPILYMQGSPLK